MQNIGTYSNSFFVCLKRSQAQASGSTVPRLTWDVPGALVSNVPGGERQAGPIPAARAMLIMVTSSVVRFSGRFKTGPRHRGGASGTKVP